jgi:hypothetical protein
MTEIKPASQAHRIRTWAEHSAALSGWMKR